MAVKCWNCRSADTTTGGGELLSCLNCGQVLDQQGNPPVATGDGDHSVTWTKDAPEAPVKGKAK